MPADRIDAHHHLWKYSPEEYPWMAANMDAIRRDFLPSDLAAVMRESGIGGVVTVQARQTLEETRWLLDLAAAHDYIRGVVGWVPLVEPTVARDLERFAGSPKLKAVRHVLHDEPDDFYMLRDDFNRGVSLAAGFGLAYDILIFERHLPQTIEFVDRHPDQVFVVDHVAKPRIRDRMISPWRERMAELAKRGRVYCKLSGMATEADWGSWTEEDLRPYMDVVLSVFGPERLMFGSDWPVILLASPYRRWADAVAGAISRLSDAEQARIMGGTAREAYRLAWG
jgi:L-fuconolactonase